MVVLVVVNVVVLVAAELLCDVAFELRPPGLLCGTHAGCRVVGELVRLPCDRGHHVSLDIRELSQSPSRMKAIIFLLYYTRLYYKLHLHYIILYYII